MSQINRANGLITILLIFAANCFASEPKEIPDLKQIFDKFKVEGSILIYNQNDNTYCGHNLKRCNVAFCPASTFKIPNTLIAFETGVATAETVFEWDGQKRALPSWEKDMTIQEAFKVSGVPVYQEIARRIGVAKMKYYTSLLNYGDLDINAQNIDRFWLEGNSSITQYQQIYFLKKLYNLELPISVESMNQVKRIMQYEVGNGYAISGKTGWAVRQKENITWFVGYVEAKGNVYFFATNVASNADTDTKSFAQIRIELTREVLKKLDIITED